MVYQSFQSDINLVSNDYYQQSIQFDEHMQSVQRTNSADVQIYYDRKNEEVVLITPFESVEGEITFFRPSDASLDFKVPIVLKDKRQTLDASEIQSGKWDLKATFTVNGEHYYKDCIMIR